MKKGTLYSIQYLRGIAATIVALYHFEPQINLVLANKNIAFNFIHYFGYLGVDLFFIISGFVIWLTTCKTNNKSASKNTVKTFLIKRLIRIYTPYIPLIVILLLAAYFINFHKIHNATIIDVLKMLSLFPIPMEKNLFPVSWTLTYEMMFYLSFSLLLLIKNPTKRLVIIVFYFILVIFLNTYITFVKGIKFYEINHIFNNVPYIDIYALSHLISPFLLEFCMGVFVAQLYLHIDISCVLKKHAHKIIVSLLILIAFSFYYSYMYKIDMNYYPIERVLIFGLLFALLTLILVCNEKRKPILSPNKFLMKLGDASYSIYLLHTIVYAFLYYVGVSSFMAKLDWLGVIIMYGIFLLMLACCIIYSRYFEIPVYNKLVKKILQKTTSH